MYSVKKWRESGPIQPVGIKPWGNKNQFGAFAPRNKGGHGRAHAKFAGFVTGGGYNATFLAMAYGNRSPFKGRVVALFDRRIKCIHVDVDNAAYGRRHGPATMA